MDQRPIGFLSPQGEYIKCSTYEHISVARDICKANGWESYHSCDDILLQHGYAHMTLSLLGKKEYCVYWERFLTEEQKNWFKPIFEADETDDVISISWPTRCKFEQEMDM